MSGGAVRGPARAATQLVEGGSGEASIVAKPDRHRCGIDAVGFSNMHNKWAVRGLSQQVLDSCSMLNTNWPFDRSTRPPDQHETFHFKSLENLKTKADAVIFIALVVQ